MREKANVEQAHCLPLTEDEALGLLDMVMTAPGEMTPEQRMVVLKLSDLCRQILRQSSEPRLHVTTLTQGAVLPGAFAA